MTTEFRGSANKHLILVITTLTQFIWPFYLSSVNIALPSIQRELSLAAVPMTWVSTAYTMSLLVCQVPLARISDIIGRRKMLFIGLIIASAASLLGGLAGSTSLLILSRVLQGIGAGMMYSNTMAIITAVYPKEERGKALGIALAGTYLGLAMGPLIGGAMTQHIGWRSIFLGSAGLGILLTVMVWFFLKAEWRTPQKEKFDTVGTVIFGVSIAMTMYGFTVIVTGLGIALFLAGAVGLGVFVWWESRVESPLLYLDMFRRNRTFLFSNLAAVVTYISTYAITYLLSLYLQYIRDMGAGDAGRILVVSPIMMTIFTPLSGRISDKIEPRLVATTGMVLNSIAAIMLIFLGEGTPDWYIIVALVCYGTGIGLFSSPNTNAIMSSVEKRNLALASGTVGTMRTTGMMLSMGVILILFTLNIGDAEIMPQYYPQFLSSVNTGFIIFSILCVGGVISQLLARGPGRATPRG